MKQAAIDPLYKDCQKQWRALHFDIQMLMPKAHFGWSDTSFNELLCILGSVLPKDNKVPTNIYRAKNLIQPVTLNLKRFHACPNHCILCRGQYASFESCPYCGASRYKRNAGCRVDANDEGASGGPKKKVAKKSNAKQISSHEEEEEGYTQRRIPALSMWYWPMIDRLHCTFGNPADVLACIW